MNQTPLQEPATVVARRMRDNPERELRDLAREIMDGFLGGTDCTLASWLGLHRVVLLYTLYRELGASKKHVEDRHLDDSGRSRFERYLGVRINAKNESMGHTLLIECDPRHPNVRYHYDTKHHSGNGEAKVAEGKVYRTLAIICTWQWRVRTRDMSWSKTFNQPIIFQHTFPACLGEIFDTLYIDHPADWVMTSPLGTLPPSHADEDDVSVTTPSDWWQATSKRVIGSCSRFTLSEVQSASGITLLRVQGFIDSDSSREEFQPRLSDIGGDPQVTLEDVYNASIVRMPWCAGISIRSEAEESVKKILAREETIS